MAQTPPENRPHSPDTIDVKDARQGGRGKRILWILLVSASAAAVVLIAVFAMYAPGLSDNEGDETEATATVSFDDNAPAPVEGQTSAREAAGQ